jgi:hypothetical protein
VFEPAVSEQVIAAVKPEPVFDSLDINTNVKHPSGLLEVIVVGATFISPSIVDDQMKLSPPTPLPSMMSIQSKWLNILNSLNVAVTYGLAGSSEQYV